ncbi:MULTISPECIES: hypothetical protein [unclassified Embleya]|uniref:hypothetical protein n=1 Tax=unclassified Embleya TaxID=2699296 RepID=UPI0033F78BE0
MTDARMRSGPRRARWWGPLAVAAVLVLLAGGWPLIGSWISGDERITTGTVFRVGPDGHRAWFRVGSGWTLDQAATTPSRVFVLRHGDVDLSIAYISLPRAEDADALWSGLRRTIRVGDPHARLGPPAPLIADAGAQGMAGTLIRGGDTGRAVIYPGPEDAFAIRLLALAPARTTDPQWLPVRDVLRSLTFTEEAA